MNCDERGKILEAIQQFEKERQQKWLKFMRKVEETSDIDDLTLDFHQVFKSKDRKSKINPFRILKKKREGSYDTDDTSYSTETSCSIKSDLYLRRNLRNFMRKGTEFDTLDYYNNRYQQDQVLSKNDDCDMSQVKRMAYYNKVISEKQDLQSDSLNKDSQTQKEMNKLEEIHFNIIISVTKNASKQNSLKLTETSYENIKELLQYLQKNKPIYDVKAAYPNKFKHYIINLSRKNKKAKKFLNHFSLDMDLEEFEFIINLIQIYLKCNLKNLIFAKNILELKNVKISDQYKNLILSYQQELLKLEPFLSHNDISLYTAFISWQFDKRKNINNGVSSQSISSC